MKSAKHPRKADGASRRGRNNRPQQAKIIQHYWRTPNASNLVTGSERSGRDHFPRPALFRPRGRVAEESLIAFSIRNHTAPREHIVIPSLTILTKASAPRKAPVPRIRLLFTDALTRTRSQFADVGSHIKQVHKICDRLVRGGTLLSGPFEVFLY
jgi:hypothetical protein